MVPNFYDFFENMHPFGLQIVSLIIGIFIDDNGENAANKKLFHFGIRIFL